MKVVILCVSLFALGMGAVSHGLYLTHQKLDRVSGELRESRIATLEAANRTVKAVDNVRLFLEQDPAIVDAREKFDALQKQQRDFTDLRDDAAARNRIDTVQAAEEKLAEIQEDQKRVRDSFNNILLPADSGKRYVKK
jgi:hypothetical protein